MDNKVTLLLTVDAEEVEGLDDSGQGGLGDKYGGKVTRLPIEIYVVMKDPLEIIGSRLSLESAKALAEADLGLPLEWEGEGRHYDFEFYSRGFHEESEQVYDIIQTKLEV